MNPDSFQQAWQSQSDRKIDVDLLIKELQMRQQQFSATLFQRDLSELAVAIAMVPIWLALGYWLKLPWTWYLTIPVLLWIGGFMLLELLRRRRTEREPAESLRQRVEHALAEVERQVLLLRNIFWWYLLPMAVSLLAFFGQIAWNIGFKLGWEAAALLLGICVGITAIVFAGVYFANQRAVRSSLEPRRRELEETLQSLNDEPG